MPPRVLPSIPAYEVVIAVAPEPETAPVRVTVWLPVRKPLSFTSCDVAILSHAIELPFDMRAVEEAPTTVRPVPPFKIGSAVPLYVIASVPDVVIGDPDIEKIEGTVAATDVTVPVFVVHPASFVSCEVLMDEVAKP